MIVSSPKYFVLKSKRNNNYSIMVVTHHHIVLIKHSEGHFYWSVMCSTIFACDCGCVSNLGLILALSW